MGIVVVATLAANAEGRGNHGDLSANQIDRERRQLIIVTLRRAVIDRHILTLDIASVFEALAKCAQTARVRVRRCGQEDPNHRLRRLLRSRRERPRGGRATEQRDELASPHVGHGPSSRRSPYRS
jgi:hypothetical protein